MAADPQEPASQNPETNDNDQFNPQVPASQPKKPKYETQTQVGKLWDAFGDPEQSANKLAGPNNPRDSDTKDVTVTGVLKSMSFDNIKSFYRGPCARDSLLTGIGVGFATGGLRSVLGGTRSLGPAANWAVGTFAAVSVASYEFCQSRRRKELDGVKQAVELMKETKIKKAQKKEKIMEERREEEEKKRKNWTNLSNYKFW